MQVKKVYKGVNPGLLYDEVRDFVQKRGAIIGDAKLETYSQPSDSSSFIYRGTLTFKASDDGAEAIRAHLVGEANEETKLILDIDEGLFPADKVSALQDDLDFVFGSYESTPR